MSKTETQESKKSGARLGLLDGLRISAALIVVLYHYTTWGHSHWGVKAPDAWPVLSEFTRYGSIGVQLFFLISGFVILMSVQGKSIIHFIGSRLGRLYPAYWLAVIAAAILTFKIWPAEKDGRSGGDIVPNLTMVQQGMGVRDLDGVYWTLWVEFRFYVLLGLLLVLGLVKTKNIMWLAFIWPALGILLHVAEMPKMQDWFAGQYAAQFAAGMVLFLIYQNGHTLGRWALVAFNTVVSAYFTGLKGSFDSDFLSGLTVPSWHFSVLAVLCVALLALCVLTPLKYVQARWLVVAGSLTYPLYLFHQLWGWWIIDSLSASVNKYVLLVLTISLMLIVAYLVARFVEKPVGLWLRNESIKSLTALNGWAKKLPLPEAIAASRERKYQQSWHQSR
ncbi:acyltransferase family protein [Glutamicibacter sp. 287]|uniref:acyltransferase family protein n=1 Tax=unclassified Glutamicibacter TaxID=2627139 RepID=UPI004033B3FD